MTNETAPALQTNMGGLTDDDLVKIADDAFAQAYVGGKAYHGHPAGMKAAVIAVRNAVNRSSQTNATGFNELEKELLSALKKIAGNGDGTGMNPHLMVDLAMIAITKAEGK